MLFLLAVGYLVVGRIVIWTISIARPTQWLWNFFDGCDLCLGVWVYFALIVSMRDLVHQLSGSFYLAGVSEACIAIVTSYLVHVFRIGFEEKYFGAHS